MITLSHITKKYGRKVALSDVSLEFGSGKIYGIVGENGAGKSTLFRCMTGLEDYEGDMLLRDGVQMGYLPDSHYFYPLMKGREYVEFCLRARGKNMNAEAVDGYNSRFKLPLDEYVSSYSLGMKKRLVLMALLLQDNDFHILDEPFNGLDLPGVIFLKKRICEVAREQGKTFVLSSHILSSLTEICDVIYYLHAGEVVRRYEPSEYHQIEDDIVNRIG